MDYFSSLFVDVDISSTLDLDYIQQLVSSTYNNTLFAPFTLDEFRVAAFQMHSNKAPGLDGLNLVFFQKFWSLVRINIYQASM